MTTLAILCSGQGDQSPAMFDLVAERPEAEPVFAAAAEALGGRDPRDVARAGDDALHANATAQVLCCTQAMAAWACLAPKLEARLVVAGYSVGEIAAWGVAGALPLAAVFDVAATRAALMDEASKAPAGLLAVRGLDRSAIGRLAGDAGVHVAIRNGDDRVVLGGLVDALDEAERLARERGAQSTTRIRVEVASHTPLLAGAATAFGAALRRRDDVREPATRLISGIDAAPVFDVRDGLDKLGRQVAQTIEWATCLEACRAAGATRALELGPGHALARCMGDVLGERDSRSLVDFRSVEGALRWATA